jgi:anti-anti-sigma factor
MLKISREDNHYSVELFQVNRLNTLFSELVKQQLQELLEEPGTSVVFNLEGIRFIDTAGFQILQEITEHATVNGSQFKLCNVSDDVRELIILTELEGSFNFCTRENTEEKILMVLD